MKQLLLILLLIPFFVEAAKYYPGTATKTDGSKLVGYFEEPDFGAVKKIKFKASLDGKKEKIRSTEFSTLEFTKNNQLIKYEMLFSKAYTLFNRKEMKMSKTPYWFKVIEKHEDSVSIYVVWVKSNDGKGNTSYSMSSYMKLPGGKELIYVQYEGSTMTEIKIGFFKAFSKTVESNFKDICPEISAKLTKELYKEKGVLLLPGLYRSHCK